MSVVAMENLPPTNVGSMNVEKLPSGRLSEKPSMIPGGNGAKTKTLRLDSPTTIEACKELGILVEDLKPKTVEDFRDPKVEEDVIQFRFNHYQKRYNQFVKDVYARKRQITRAQQRHRRNLQQGGMGSEQGSYGAGMNSFRMNSTMKNSVSAAHTLLPNPMLNNYNRTISYLRASHDIPETKSIQDIIGKDGGSDYGLDDTVEQFDTALGQEISKFNKIKRQKQKEAKDAFEEELKRVKIVEDLKDKEKRMREREKKQAVDKKKQDEEKRRKAEDKLEQIRDAERKYRTHKQEEKDRIKKKLEETKKKFAEEVEERKKLLAENEEKLEQKRRIAEERRIELKFQEQAQADALKVELDAKMYRSEDQYNHTINDRMTRVKSQILKVQDSVKKFKERQEQEEAENVQRLLQKLVKKEEVARAFQHKQNVEMKKREKEIAEKTRRFQDHKSDINQQYKDRMKEINERFQRVQENLEAKREQEEKDMKLRQEMTRLKILDKQDNYNRKLRQTQYERQKILDRQKYNAEKLVWLKNQREVLQQAKVEVSIQSKIEKERIEQAVQLLSKLTNETGTSNHLNEQQKKLLKQVLTPEDYQRIEDDERRKEQERLDAEEAKKMGNMVVPAVKAR